jgi:hypothetical protein
VCAGGNILKFFCSGGAIELSKGIVARCAQSLTKKLSRGRRLVARCAQVKFRLSVEKTL